MIAISSSKALNSDHDLVRVQGITKKFGSFTALNNVSLEVRSGEILAILGHNGSGKSTLVKVLAGVESADSGSIELSDHGDQIVDMQFIHQNLGLIQELTAVENMMILPSGEKGVWTPINKKGEARKAKEHLALFSDNIPTNLPISKLTPAEQTVIAIVRALMSWTHDRNVLVLDEPTESLHKSEVDKLFTTMRQVADKGAGVVFISHRLDEVLQVADRIIVLRDGEKIAELDRKDVDNDRLIELITGSKSAKPHVKRDFKVSSEKVLEVENLATKEVQALSFTLNKGEILGIAGTLGSGREEVAQALFDSSVGTSDSFFLNQKETAIYPPSGSIKNGVGFLPSDRPRLGSVYEMSATENLTLANTTAHLRLGSVISHRSEIAEMENVIESFDVKPKEPNKKFGTFSGGNQQKILLAKWLRLQPSVLILDEPTQGVDIGAKNFIYKTINEIADQGTSVVVCSSEAKELANLCDRVIVLNDGKAIGELSGAELNESAIIRLSYSS